MAAAVSDRLRLPFAPGAVRDFLRQDDELVRIVPANLITTRDVPDLIERPFILLRPTAMVGSDPKVRMAMVQVDVFAPPPHILRAEPAPILADPEEVAWDLAGYCGEILNSVRNREFRNCGWNGQWVDGPGSGPTVDTSRGKGLPLYRQTVRVQLTMTSYTLPSFTWAQQF